MLELSNETENLKRKIETNRERFASFIIISELSNKAEKFKRKISANRERFLTFFIHFGIEQQNGNTKKENEN